MDKSERTQRTINKIIRVLENMNNEERLEEMGLFILEKGQFRKENIT